MVHLPRQRIASIHVVRGRSQPLAWPCNGSDEIIGQECVALSVSEQADEGLRIATRSAVAARAPILDLTEFRSWAPVIIIPWALTIREWLMNGMNY